MAAPSILADYSNGLAAILRAIAKAWFKSPKFWANPHLNL